MSTLNFVQQRDDESFVMVDTRNSFGAHTSKMIPLPHLGAILAVRGRTYLFLTMMNSLLTGFETFDAALENVPAVFDQARAAVADIDHGLAASTGVTVDVMRTKIYAGDMTATDELLLTGWSEGAGSVQAIYITAPAAGGPATVTKNLGVNVAPAQADVVRALRAAAPTDETALQVVRAQLALCGKGETPGFGGRLLLGRVTRNEIRVRDVGSI